jgi:ketosteroid isomerase-like protein
MNRNYYLIFLLCYLLACNPNNNQPAQRQDSLTYKNIKMNENNAEKELLSIVKTWNQSFATNNVETYFSFIHPNLTLFIPSSPYRIDGKIIDREEFEWSLKTSRSKVHFFQELQPLVQVFGNTAIVTYHNRGAYGPDGNEQIAYIKETNVLVKENDEWKIVHIHTSK